MVSFGAVDGVAATPHFSHTRYEFFREIPGSFTRLMTRLQREQMMVCQTKRFGVFHVPMKSDSQYIDYHLLRDYSNKIFVVCLDKFH